MSCLSENNAIGWTKLPLIERKIYTIRFIFFSLEKNRIRLLNCLVHQISLFSRRHDILRPCKYEWNNDAQKIHWPGMSCTQKKLKKISLARTRMFSCNKNWFFYDWIHMDRCRNVCSMLKLKISCVRCYPAEW